MAQRSKTIDVTAQRAGRVARAVGVLGAAWAWPALPGLALTVLSISAAAQSAGDGMIMIPGNGGAQASTQGQSTDAARAEAQFQAAARGAQIVIPGNADGGAKPTGMTIETVRGPGGASVASHPNNGFSTTPGVAEPGLHPAVASLLANRAMAANSANEPAAPAGADLARLQQQAATELNRDASTGATAGNGSRGNGPAMRGAVASAESKAGADANAGAQAGAQASANAKSNTAGNANANSGGAPANGGLKFSQTVTVPNARTMPSPEKVMPGQDLGSAMSPAARFASVNAVSRQAGQRSADAAGQDGQSLAAGSDASTGSVRGTGPAVQPVTVVSSSGPPIEHSVTIAHSDSTIAVPTLPGKQDPAVLTKTAEDFLRQQANGLPGRVTITVPPVNPHGLAACTNLEPFMAPGAPLWGRTTVGVRCIGDKPWTLYVLARISVQATYYVAARQIMPGDVIQASDLLPRDGDLAVMPRAIVTDPSQAIGGVAQNRLTPGLPVRTDLIRSTSAIQMGQTVKVVAEGNGFSISAGGSALNNASPGQQVRVKMENGETVVGTVAGRGVVQIPM